MYTRYVKYYWVKGRMEKGKAMTPQPQQWAKPTIL